MSRVIVVRGGSRRSVIKAGMRGVPGADGEGGGGSSGVSSFNDRGGAVRLVDSDVTSALGYAPANSADMAEVAFSGAYSALSGKPAIPALPSDIGAATSAQGAKADTALQPGSFAAVATSGSYADLAAKPFIPTAPGDIGAASAAQGALADTAVQPSALAVQLDLKVDKITGYGLSQENYTAAEKAKLAGLEGSHYRGTYLSLAALQAAIPVGTPGDYADVDAGTGSPVLRYIWDENDGEWIAQAGSADPITAAQVKTLYESNPDTNAYTDAEKSKLGGIAANATANPDTDSLAESGSPTNKWFTVARVLASVLTGLSVATGGAVVETDTVLAAIGKLQKQITDLNTVVAGKQAALISATNIKTVNGGSLLGAGDLVVAAVPAVVTLESAATRVSEIGDAARFVVFENPAASTYTVEPQTSVAWAASAELQVYRKAAGTLTLTAGAGVTLKAGSGGTLVMTDGMAALIKRVGVDTWVVVGQTVPS